MKIELIHNQCGGVAFLYEESALVRYADAESRHASHVDGSPIPSGSLMLCDSCGEVVSPHSKFLRRKDGPLFGPACPSGSESQAPHGTSDG